MRKVFFALIGVALTATAVVAEPWSDEEFFAAVKRNDETAGRRTLEEGVAWGSPRARCLLAYTLFRGIFLPDEGLKPDYKRVFSLLDGLAFEQCLDRSILLPIMYRDGKGVQPDAKLAEHYFRKQVVFFGYDEGGDYRWGSFGQIERFDPRPDLRTALSWWKRVKTEWPAAKFLMKARSFFAGEGEPQDSDMGYRFLRMAADRGSREARQELSATVDSGKVGAYAPGLYAYQMRLGALIRYFDSRPIKLDRKILGEIYLNGLQGEAKNLTLAYTWFLAAEKAGDESVTPALRELENDLPREVIEWAHDWVNRGWWP